MKDNQKFSLKKLLLCILCSVVVTTSLGMTKLFIQEAPIFMVADFSTTINEESETFKEYLRKIEKQQGEIIKDWQTNTIKMYGEDYPTEGLLIFNLTNTINFIKTQSLVETYVSAVIRGVYLGAIVYIIVVQKAKGKKLLLEILIGVIIILALMVLANLGYECLYNVWINSVEENIATGYNSYIYDFEDSRILIGFVIILIAVYLGNLIKQKSITNKLNKEIEKINK